jgi:hypothetical protein
VTTVLVSLVRAILTGLTWYGQLVSGCLAWQWAMRSEQPERALSPASPLPVLPPGHPERLVAESLSPIERELWAQLGDYRW